MEKEKELLEKYDDLAIEIENHVKEKREHEKLKGTKFEEAAALDDVRINGLLTGIHKERAAIKEKVLGMRKSIFDEYYLEISRELNIKPLFVPKDEKITFDEYSSKAVENLNSLFYLSETFQKCFSEYSKNGNFLHLLSIGNEYSFSLIIVKENDVLCLKLVGYVPGYLNFSSNNSDSAALQLKHVIRLLENKDSALKFIFDNIWVKIGNF